MHYLNYELSKALADKGIVAPTLEQWAFNEGYKKHPFILSQDDACNELDVADFALTPAPDFLELWRLLPRSIAKNHMLYWLGMHKLDSGQTTICYQGMHERVLISYDDSNQGIVDAAGQLLCHLIEKKYLTTPTVNPEKSNG